MRHDPATVARYRARYGLLQALDDIELAHVSLTETGAPVPDGEEYIDLEYPERGVQKAGRHYTLTSEVAILHSSVKPETWSKLVAALPQHGRRT